MPSLLQRKWEQKSDEDALIDAVRIGFIQEGWVGRAILELQWQRLAGATKQERDRAQRILEKVG